MDSIWLVIVVLFISVANTIFLLLLYRDVLQKMKEYDKKLSGLKLDTQIADAFYEDGTDHEDLNKISMDLFHDVKKAFGLEGNTFSEFVALLKDKPVKNVKLKEALVHFFDKITVYSYQNVEMNEKDRELLKDEYKLIVSMVDEHKRQGKK